MGIEVGLCVGSSDGAFVGLNEGTIEGCAVGIPVVGDGLGF